MKDYDLLTRLSSFVIVWIICLLSFHLSILLSSVVIRSVIVYRRWLMARVVVTSSVISIRPSSVGHG